MKGAHRVIVETKKLQEALYLLMKVIAFCRHRGLQSLYSNLIIIL